MRGTRAGSWRARLELGFERSGPSTILRVQKHEGPLVVQRPFYPEGDVCHAYVLHPPGGVVAGDSLHLHVRADAGAHALITTPAAGKFYRSEGATATVRQDFELRDANLEWLPQESIYFPRARVDVRSTIRLGGSARFLGWEIACLGLPARGESFDSGTVHQGVSVLREGSPVLLEAQELDPEVVAGRWGMRRQGSIGTMIAVPADESMLAAARASADLEANARDAGNELLACTLVDGILVCRGLAARGERLRNAFAGIWRAIRPRLLGRGAVSPRIWAT